MCSVVLVVLNDFEYRCKEIVLFNYYGYLFFILFQLQVLAPTHPEPLELCMHAYDLFLFTYF